MGGGSTQGNSFDLQVGGFPACSSAVIPAARAAAAAAAPAARTHCARGPSTLRGLKSGIWEVAEPEREHEKYLT